MQAIICRVFRITGPVSWQLTAKGLIWLLMEAAFKEWRVVVDALGRGDQIVIMRKGGIDEGENGFEIKHHQFWLFPTLFHQQKDFVIPIAARHMTLHPDDPIIPIQYHCEVVAHYELTQLEQIEKMRGQHVWKDEVLIQRMTSGDNHQLHALLVRVSKLPHAIEIPLNENYGGCRSWIRLKENLDSSNCTPILDQAHFTEKIQAFKNSIT